jgi:hypothetical protein
MRADRRPKGTSRSRANALRARAVELRAHLRHQLAR